MKNRLGRDIPEYIEGYGNVKQYEGCLANNIGKIKKILNLIQLIKLMKNYIKILLN